MRCFLAKRVTVPGRGFGVFWHIPSHAGHRFRAMLATLVVGSERPANVR